MSYKTAMQEILREYEEDRLSARHALSERQAAVYAALPRVREIDETLAQTGAAIVRQIIAQPPEEAPALQQTLKERNTALLAEKEALLTAAGYPADYLALTYKCALCRDTGRIDGMKCRCLKQRLINQHYHLSTLGDVLRRENFDTFDLRYYDQQRDERLGVSPQDNIKLIYQTCLDFATHFGQKNENLLLYGPTGLGKTFLCNCIAKEVLDGGHTVLYTTAPQLFKIVEDLRFHRDELEEPSEYMETLHAVDLLIIDDLGTEFSTLVTLSELFGIINTRLLTSRPTIISTNLSPTDFESQYSDRIISRFLGYYKMLRFFGDDIRELKKYRRYANG